MSRLRGEASCRTTPLPTCDDEAESVDASIALEISMDVLDAARTGRYDILRATTALAKQVTK